MFEHLRYLFEPELEEAELRGVIMGKNEGALIKAVEDVNGIMEEFGVSLERACKAAKITPEQYHEYLEKFCLK